MVELLLSALEGLLERNSMVLLQQIATETKSWMQKASLLPEESVESDLRGNVSLLAERSVNSFSRSLS